RIRRHRRQAAHDRGRHRRAGRAGRHEGRVPGAAALQRPEGLWPVGAGAVGEIRSLLDVEMSGPVRTTTTEGVVMRAGMVVLGCLAFACAAVRPSPVAPVAPAERHRSPADVTILPDGRRALTANHTADSVSLVDLDAGKVLAEVACGRRPVAVARSADG